MGSALRERKGILRIQLFGAFRVERDGKPLEGLHLREGQRLLAYLILKQGDEVTYRNLAEGFWPAEARNRFAGGGDLASTRQALRSLRVALGPDADCLENTGRGRVRLNLNRVEVDIFQFDALAASTDNADWIKAVALYRGPLLENFTESWVGPARNRRQREYDRLLKRTESIIANLNSSDEDGRRTGNLPHPLTSFVGRELQILEVQTALRATRLLTLTGTGGCGKTRLSLRVVEPIALGNLAFYQGDYAAARIFYEEARTHAIASDEQQMEAMAWSGLGKIAVRHRDTRLAYECFTNSNRANITVQDTRLFVVNLRGFGDIARLNGDLPEAKLYYQQSIQPLDASSPIGEQIFGLECLAVVSIAEGYRERGKLFWGAATAQRHRLSIPVSPSDQAYFAPEFAELRDTLGETAFAAIWAQGWTTPFEDALAAAMNL